MINSVTPARSDYGQIVGALCSMRQPVRYPQPAFAVLTPLPLVRQQGRIDFTHRGYRLVERCRQRLSGKFSQQWLRIKQVDVAGPTLHEQKNNVRGPGAAVRRHGSGRTDVCLRFLLQQSGQRKSSKPCPRRRQHLSSRSVIAHACIVLCVTTLRQVCVSITRGTPQILAVACKVVAGGDA